MAWSSFTDSTTILTRPGERPPNHDLTDGDHKKMQQNNFSRYALQLLGLIEHIGLAVITIATVIAMVGEVNVMITSQAVTLADLLLLFLYLEILAMVGLYYQSGKLPVRFPIYIAIVALARYMVLDMKSMDEWRLLGVAAGIMLLALAVLAIRYGHSRFPYTEND